MSENISSQAEVIAAREAEAFFQRSMREAEDARANIAIWNLTELALYSGECLFGNVIDDELYNVIMQDGGYTAYCNDDRYSWREATTADSNVRRMYFLFLAEMLKDDDWNVSTVDVDELDSLPETEWRDPRHEYALRKMVTPKPTVPAHVAVMANAVLNQLDTGDLDRQAVRAVCEWVSIQQKTENYQG